MNRIARYKEQLDAEFRTAYLIGHFIREELTEEEEAELEQWILETDQHLQLFEELTDERTVKEFMQWYYTRETERKLEEVKQRIQFTADRKRIPLWHYVAAAACIIGLAVGAIYVLQGEGPASSQVTTKQVHTDILPGGKAATLTLSNGRQINLAEVKDTVIDAQVRIVNGVVIYQNSSEITEYHELTIPRRGFYKLVLPDGTNVWINSVSSIRYPSRFNGPERRVTVTGETYFEVAKDSLHPFIVSSNGADITALGTAFNIRAYPEEGAMQVTLTEGRIRVSAAGRQEQLLPGQQVIIGPDQWSLTKVDTEPLTAWTRNQFKLKNSSIEDVMRMAERWYGAKVVYRDRITDHFTGTIDRTVPVSQLLKLLEATGQVHFSIDQNTITVSR